MKYERPEMEVVELDTRVFTEVTSIENDNIVPAPVIPGGDQM